MFDDDIGFLPSPELADWIEATFLDSDSALHNPDHAHLRMADLGFLWARVDNSRAGRTVIGQCEFKPPAVMGKWPRARAQQQLHAWFGRTDLDFLITFDATYCLECSDAEFCALVEHELYHAGQAHDAFGFPRFSKASGLPVFAIRGHDVEEFVGVVRRYGADAAHIRALIDAGTAKPEIAPVRIAQACGTCHLRVA
jgi:hypothetical protein